MEAIDKIETDQNNSVLLYLVEQFGDKVKELSNDLEASFTKVRYEGKADELAKYVESLHYHPMATTTVGIKNAMEYLTMLVHQKMMKELYLPNKEKITALYGVKKNFTYLIQLNSDEFEGRDFFRQQFSTLHDEKPYAEFLNVNLEFLPHDATDADLFLNDLEKLEL